MDKSWQICKMQEIFNDFKIHNSLTAILTFTDSTAYS